MAEDKTSEKKTGLGKWVFITIVILLLAFTSMIIAGILGIVMGLSSERSGTWTTKETSGNVALIKVNGIITTQTSSSMFGSNDVSSADIMDLLNNIKNDRSISAVIIEINSPGGSGVASDEISRAIKSLNKTTVSYIRDIGASGGYWVASASDHIIANRLSFVGSIGVMGSYLEFSGLLDDFNITYNRFVGGEYKDFGSPFRKPEESESAMFQNQIDQVHDIFIKEIAENRNMKEKDVREIAHGMIFTGVQAKELGLIDEFGGRQEAITYLEDKLNVSVNIIEFRKKVTFLDMLMGVMSSRSYNVGRGIGDSVVKSSIERKIIV
jgi:protease IV